MTTDDQAGGKTVICIVGCGKAKLNRPAPAREMYVSTLCRSAIEYAERVYPGRWMILSAGYGIVTPDYLMEPYERTLSFWNAKERQQLGQCWHNDLQSRFPAITPPIRTETHVLEMHCGEDYADVLAMAGNPFDQIRPLAGLMIGHRLAWYAARREEAAAARRRANETPSMFGEAG